MSCSRDTSDFNNHGPSETDDAIYESLPWPVLDEPKSAAHWRHKPPHQVNLRREFNSIC
jgi:hypothetical protein